MTRYLCKSRFLLINVYFWGLRMNNHDKITIFIFEMVNIFFKKLIRIQLQIFSPSSDCSSRGWLGGEACEQRPRWRWQGRWQIRSSTIRWFSPIPPSSHTEASGSANKPNSRAPPLHSWCIFVSYQRQPGYTCWSCATHMDVAYGKGVWCRCRWPIGRWPMADGRWPMLVPMSFDAMMSCRVITCHAMS